MLDDSDYYVQRCIDVGNNRTSKLINQKSKYLFSKTNIDVSRIKVLGDNTYHFPSENEQDTYYFVDMEIGLSECPVGLSRGPCKHKHVLTKECNLISFDTIPTESCEMRSFYHFLGTGQREVPTWYRPLHLPEMDLSTMPAVEDISASRIPLHQPVHDVLTIPAENENNASEDDDNRIYVKTSFFNSANNLLRVLEERFGNDPDNYAKAMSAFNKQCDILVTSSDAAIQTAQHTFGKEHTTAIVAGKKKNSGKIPVQNKSKARRKHAMRGSGSSIMGRPTQYLPQTSNNEDNVVYHSLPKQKKKNKPPRPHSLTTVVEVNVPSDKKH